jgi:hypothetical protein
MSININPMGWRRSEQVLDFNKTYVPKPFKLIIRNGEILPFQLTHERAGGIGGTYTCKIRQTTGALAQVAQFELSVVSEIDQSDDRFYNIRYFGGVGLYDLTDGCYQATFEDVNGRKWFSEIIHVRADVSMFIQIQYSSRQNLILSDQVIYFTNAFRFKVYLDTIVARPVYEYEEEVTEKNGLKFTSSQVARKVYRMGLPIPEFLADALSIIRLCDFKRIIAPDQIYNVIDFIFNPEWPERGDLAEGNIEFLTASIIKKVNAFANVDNLGEYSDVQYNNDYKNQNS